MTSVPSSGWRAEHSVRMSIPRVPRDQTCSESPAPMSTSRARLDNRYALLLVLCVGSLALHVWYNQMISQNDTVVAGRLRFGREYASQASLAVRDGTPSVTVSVLRDDRSEQNVLSFSLYGSKPRYTVGAVENAKLVRQVYPGWSMHVFHDESVPLAVLLTLQREAVKLHYMNQTGVNQTAMNKMSWRFLPGAGFDNRTVRFCSRDIDSRLSLREKSAVDAWINSGKAYHVMRDHPLHSRFAMSGGMWCANASTFGFLARQMVHMSTRDDFSQDNNWLNARVWPEAVKDVLQHDSFSCTKYKGSVPFPTRRVGWEHVGSVYLNGQMREGDVEVLRHAKAPLECTPAATGAVSAQLDIRSANSSLVLFPPNFSDSQSGNIFNSLTHGAVADNV